MEGLTGRHLLIDYSLFSPFLFEWSPTRLPFPQVKHRNILATQKNDFNDSFTAKILETANIAANVQVIYHTFLCVNPFFVSEPRPPTCIPFFYKTVDPPPGGWNLSALYSLSKIFKILIDVFLFCFVLLRINKKRSAYKNDKKIIKKL